MDIAETLYTAVRQEVRKTRRDNVSEADTKTHAHTHTHTHTHQALIRQSRSVHPSVPCTAKKTVGAMFTVIKFFMPDVRINHT